MINELCRECPVNECFLQERTDMILQQVETRQIRIGTANSLLRNLFDTSDNCPPKKRTQIEKAAQKSLRQ
jgi:hypothetical protein